MPENPPTLLLVDDETENLDALTRYLAPRHPDWKIVSCQSEVESGRLLDGGLTPDVVVTDLVMGHERSGLDVLEQAKARNPLTMVIVVTAYERKLDRYSAFELGAFDCVAKNAPGVIAAQEIDVKVTAAMGYLSQVRQRLELERRITLASRHLDPNVYDMLARSEELLEPRRRSLTVVFWDIRGFSGLSESLREHPGAVTDFLTEYFEAAVDAVFENAGVLDKFIGDGVMGLFGLLPESSPNDGVADALRAAIALRESFGTLLAPWTSQWNKFTPHQIDIGLACGVHSGEALVGNIGTPTRDQFTALGPSVNFAQRLESRAGRAQILMSQTVVARMNGTVEVSPAGSINDVKNVPGTFEIFQLESLTG